MEAEETQCLYYDFESQISYLDKEFKQKVVSLHSQERSVETRVLENSDVDEFRFNGKGTRSTFTLEDSDPNEFIAKRGTAVTESIENSDYDEFNVFKATGGNKKSDISNVEGVILKSKKTRQTNTLENSDYDEFTLN